MISPRFLALFPVLAILACGNPASPGVLGSMEFVPIPPGSFTMGSPEDEPGRYPDEGPRHTVNIDCQFEMLSTEVTQEMWEQVMGENPSTFSGRDLPVESVSWYDCQLFLEHLNQIDRSHLYRLPSEAEWEYACRAGSDTPYYSGSSEDDLDDIGWYSGNSTGINEAAGSKQPNAWGLYDMSGNVWELCADSYHDGYTGAPADGSAWISPGAETVVSRGGSVGSAARRCRSAARDECHRTLRYQYLGFRVVRTPV